jgi:hypothetical protein
VKTHAGMRQRRKAQRQACIDNKPRIASEAWLSTY